MKRALRVVEGADDSEPSDALLLRLGGSVVSVRDAGNGASALRFAAMLVDAGARVLEPSDAHEPDIGIVVRAPLQSTQALLRSERLEASADLILGSARPEFARHFASACSHRLRTPAEASLSPRERD